MGLPSNLLTDIAYKLREKFGFKGEKILNVSKKFALLLASARAYLKPSSLAASV